MIPKIIHYCWFGGNPLPPMALKCIESWKKYFPDYEIKRWDESNFDVNLIPYTRQAYESKKFAFVSDYARLWILYQFGGIYFDTDVEVIKSFDNILEKGPFMGCENPSIPGHSPEELGVNPGLGIGSTPHHPFYKEILKIYEELYFIKPNGDYNTTTIVDYTSKLLKTKGLKNIGVIQTIDNINIYPNDYFCPYNYKTKQLLLTDNSYSIHLYAESWHGKKEKFYKFVSKIFGQKLVSNLLKIYKRLINSRNY